MKLRSGTSIVQPKRKIALYGSPKNERAAKKSLRSSRLLGLPQEVKNLIYQYVCGGQTIHVFLKANKLFHFVCVAGVTAAEVHRGFLQAGKDDIAEYTENPHAKCGSGHNIHLTLSLSILQTCRQIYHEAKDVPVAHNGFECDGPEPLFRFISSLNITPTKPYHVLRKLKLQMTIYHPESEDVWARAIKEIGRNFKNLRAIDIIVDQVFCVCWVERCTFEDAPTSRLWLAIQDLKQLRKLDDVSIVIRNEGFLAEAGIYSDHMPEYDRWKWTLQQRQEWATHVGQEMLTH